MYTQKYVLCGCETHTRVLEYMHVHARILRMVICEHWKLKAGKT